MLIIIIIRITRSPRLNFPNLDNNFPRRLIKPKIKFINKMLINNNQIEDYSNLAMFSWAFHPPSKNLQEKSKIKFNKRIYKYSVILPSPIRRPGHCTSSLDAPSSFPARSQPSSASMSHQDQRNPDTTCSVYMRQPAHQPAHQALFGHSEERERMKSTTQKRE